MRRPIVNDDAVVGVAPAYVAQTVLTDHAYVGSVVVDGGGSGSGGGGGGGAGGKGGGGRDKSTRLRTRRDCSGRIVI